MTQLLSRKLWKTISALSKHSKRTKVAVAYFGKGAADRLTLKKGDTLLVAMSTPNVEAGQVCPDDIQKVFDKGVLIYTLNHLHAKVYLFDDQVIVGSANVSNRSANYLLESAIVTDDKSIVRDAERFISENCLKKVSQDYINLCKTHYQPPRVPTSEQPGTADQRISRLWVISTHRIDLNDDDNSTIDQHQGHYDRELAEKEKATSKQLRYPAKHRFVKHVQKDDRVIELFRDGTRTVVYGPTRVMGVETNDGNGRAYVWLEEPNPPPKESWTEFEKYLRRSGVKGITKSSTRLIKDETVREILLDRFS